MTDRNLDQLLNAWMDLGPTSAPDRVADAARLEAETTRQTAIRTWWPPRRFPTMNSTAKIVVATAAVVVAAILGYSYLVGPNVGGPTITPSQPSPTPIPTAQSPSQPPSQSPAQTDVADFPGYPGAPQPVDAGVYRLPSWHLDPLNHVPISISFVVPDGWLSCTNNAGLLCPTDGVGGVNIFIVPNVVAAPCDESTRRDPPMGPTVDDLVTAISSLPWSAVTPPTDVTVDGFRGKEFEATASTTSPCAGTADWAIVFIDGQGDFSPGVRNRLRILDVQGTRVVIAGTHLPGTTSSQDVAEINAIIDSVHIEPLGD